MVVVEGNQEDPVEEAARIDWVVHGLRPVEGQGARSSKHKSLLAEVADEIQAIRTTSLWFKLGREGSGMFHFKLSFGTHLWFNLQYAIKPRS